MDREKSLKVEKSKFNMSLLWAILLGFIVAGVTEILWLIKFANTPQKYTSPILGELAGEFTNKSIENVLYWVAGVLGLAVIVITYILSNKNKSESKAIEWSESTLVISILGVYMASQYFLWTNLNPITVLLFATACIATAVCKEYVLECMALFLTYYYGIIGIYRLYVYFKSDSGFSLNNTLCVLITFIFTLLTIYMTRGNVGKELLISQLLVVFLPVIFLTDKYIYAGTVVEIKPNKAVYVLIIGWLFLAILAAFLKIKKYWNDIADISGCISVFTPIAIMAFNRFSGAGYIMTTDMHHPAENVIAFKEVFKFGQKLFSEYIPISGLFSVVQGAFFELFGDGKYTSYYLTEDIFYLAIAALMVISIRLHINSLMTLIISAFIYIIDYNRVVLILPFALILLAKKLVDKPVYWFVVWVLLGWAYGLYYPAYGIAIVFAMLPLGAYQVPRVLKDIREADRNKKIRYSILGISEIALIIWSIPLLIGTAKHAIVMSDGMLYIEGVTTFGQAVAGEFLSYLNTNDKLYTIRLILGYVVRFTIPLLLVWLGFCSLFAVAVESEPKTEKKFKLSESKAICLTLFLLPLVCFYFSLQRVGRGMFNKATYIIVYVAIVMMLVLFKRGKNIAEKYILLLVCAFACAMSVNAGITNTDGKFFSKYIVPEDYVYVEDNALYPDLGTGFVQADQLKDIQDKAVKYSKMDNTKSYFMLYTTDMQADYGMGLDLILNIKGNAVLESMTVMSDKATIETAQSLIANKAIVGNALTLPMHYNIYRWLMTSNQYIWDKEQSVFYPVEGQSVEEIRQCNANAIMRKQAGECEKFAASLGNSIDTLEKESLEETKIGYSSEIVDDYVYLKFDETVDGNDVDYINFNVDYEEVEAPYILGDSHIANNKIETMLMKRGINKGLRACIEWHDDVGNAHTIYTDAENGKLLFPIGAGTGWLCNGHSEVKIWFEQDGNVTDIPEKYDVKFYHQKDLDF